MKWKNYEFYLIDLVCNVTKYIFLWLGMFMQILTICIINSMSLLLKLLSGEDEKCILRLTELLTLTKN